MKFAILVFAVLSFSLSASAQSKLELLKSLDISGTLKESKLFFGDKASIELKVIKDGEKEDFYGETRVRDGAEFSISYDDKDYVCRGVVGIWENEDEMGADIESSMVIDPIVPNSAGCPFSVQLDIGSFDSESTEVYVELTVSETNSSSDNRVFKGTVSRN